MEKSNHLSFHKSDPSLDKTTRVLNSLFDALIRKEHGEYSAFSTASMNNIHRPVPLRPCSYYHMLPPLSYLSTFPKASQDTPNTNLLVHKASPAPQVKRETESDESLDNTSPSSGSTSLLGENAYQRRNVYKSIIRHMFCCIRKNRTEVIQILKGHGYDMQQIEHAFFKISYFNDLERKKGNPKKSQAKILKIAKQKSIYTYILRETLNAMINNWSSGRTGKISPENVQVYKDACSKIYVETVRLLAQPAQGNALVL